MIVGPTASGKSALAVKIALRLRGGQPKTGGEIVSADSRQVYRGMNIGTGKIARKEMRGVPHHLLDVANPKRIFTVTQYLKLADEAIEKIRRNGSIPIVCGGTGFYIRALIDRIKIPDVPPNPCLRKFLAKKSTRELFEMLRKKDPERAAIIDKNNPVRLIRALEIVNAIGKVPEIKFAPKNNVLFLGMKKSSEKLKEAIRIRFKKRIRAGMIREIKKLHADGVSWKRLERFGLEYRYGALYLQHKISKKEFENELLKEIIRYSKRQITWFKKDRRIHWLQNPKEGMTLVEKFLEKQKARVRAFLVFY